MAEAEEKEQSGSGEPPQEAAAKKGGLAQEWRRLATWQKAGVLIGGGALVVAVMIYINHQAAPAATGNDTTGSSALMPSGSMTGYPGEGDQFPPVPVPPTTPPPTSPAPVKPPTSPVSPIHGGPIVGRPISPISPVHANPIKAPAPVATHNSKGDLSARQRIPAGQTGLNVNKRQTISGNQIKLFQSSNAARSIIGGFSGRSNGL